MKTRLRLYLLLPIIVLQIGSVYAQSLSHSLLWRITGKNNPKPSYLYGTMHLTDERIFNLGDSLYHAIENTDGFAMEIDPNQMTAFVIDMVRSQVENSRNIREVLSDKDYRKLGPLLSKKLNKPVDEISTRDILKEKHKWMSEAFKTGKMPTFLDFYLFDIARRQNKWTGGIEDMEDQRGLIDDIVDKGDIEELAMTGAKSNQNSVEVLTKLYLREDVNAIDSFVRIEHNGEEDPMMLRRNRKMALRMDSLSAVRSMVFAVGAAHLGGKNGVIELLRAKGFDVQPVSCGKRIKASGYKVREIPLTWVGIDDESGLYRASMPGKPGNMKFAGIVEMKMFIDFFNFSGYITMAAPSAYSRERTDSLAGVAAEQIFGKKISKQFAPLTRNGAKGRLYAGLTEDGFKKGFILTKEGVLYMAMGFSMKEDTPSLKNIEQFLASFTVRDLPKAEKNVWTDTAMAYQLVPPGKPVPFENPPSVKTPDHNSKLYYCADMERGGYYMYGVNRINPGYVITDDSTHFREVVKAAEANLSTLTIDTSYFLNGFRVMEFGGKMIKADLIMRARYYTRGNQWYGLLAMTPPALPDSMVIQFLNSFRMLDYPRLQWQKSISPDKVFSTWAPSAIDTVATEAFDNPLVERQYNSFDSTRSNSFITIVQHLGPYYWSFSDSAFWAERVSSHISRTDSLVYKRAVGDGEAKGWELMKLEGSSRMYQRQRILLNGDKLYSLYACAPLADIQSPDVNRFFEDFRFSGSSGKTSYFDSKAERLLHDLLGGDSAAARAAYDYMGNAPFRGSDLPLLHEALLKIPLSPAARGLLDQDNNYLSLRRINTSISDAILRVNDPSSFLFAAKRYTAVPDSCDYIKHSLLTIMAHSRDSARYREMAGLLLNAPPRSRLPYDFLEPLKDTLQLTVQIMPQLLPLLADSFMRPSITDLAVKLSDSNLLSLPKLAPYQPAILAYASSRVKTLSISPNEYELDDIWLMQLLGHMNSVPCRTALIKFLSVKNNLFRMHVVNELLLRKLPVAPEILESLARDKRTRLDLYRGLKNAGKQSLFPLAWRTQSAFGASEVYDAMNPDGDYDPTISFLLSKLISTPSGKKKFYFYLVHIPGTEKPYLAGAGPYDVDPSKLAVSDEEGGPKGLVNLKDQYDPVQIKEQIRELLERKE